MHENVAGIHPRARRAARMLGLLLLVGLAPACYSRSGKTYTPPPTIGAGALFSESFFPTWPNSNWSVPTPTNTTVGMGYIPPTYDAQMDPTATRPGSASAKPIMSFAPQPLTFKVDLRFSASGALTLTDTASVQIIDSTPTVLAQAVLDPVAGMISFTVGGASAGTAAFTASTFHTLTFTIDGSNMATWTLGAGSPSTPLAFGSHTTFLQLSASFGSGTGNNPSFQFANVIVTTP